MPENQYEHNHGLSRRQFVAGVGAGLLLTACGKGSDILVLPEAEPMPEQLANTGINGPATAHAQAERLSPPTTTIPPNIWTPGQFVTHVLVNGNLMALTFDDGPSPYNTEPILRDLEKHNVYATFFVIGAMVRAFPQLLRQVRDAGHEIGNHSVHHSPYQASPLAAQVPENQQIIREVSGVTPAANRAPGLTKGQVILNMLRSLGMYEMHTNFNYTDWQSPRKREAALIDEFIASIAPGRPALHHDGGNARPTANVVGSFITAGHQRGYRFVRATELVNSGIPMPASGVYLQQELLADSAGASVEPTYEDYCNFDLGATLLDIKKNGNIDHHTEWRINEELLELENLAKQE